jgi:hypothetical protein
MSISDRLTLQKDAANPGTSPARLEAIAHKSTDLGRLVANNPNAPGEVLKKLGRSPDIATRHLVAQNPNTPLSTLLELLEEFRKPVMNNPSFIHLSSDQIKTGDRGSGRNSDRSPIDTTDRIYRVDEVHPAGRESGIS